MAISRTASATPPETVAETTLLAAVTAARAARIVLTARADGVICGSYDQAEALRRCQAFAGAGADVIYAPPADAETTRAMAATGTPVNLLAASAMRELTPEQMGRWGSRASPSAGVWPGSHSR